MPKPDEAHEAGGAEDVGETGSEPAFSMSARRQACEQYAPLDDCRSQARQKSGDQCISAVMVKCRMGREAEEQSRGRIDGCVERRCGARARRDEEKYIRWVEKVEKARLRQCRSGGGGE